MSLIHSVCLLAATCFSAPVLDDGAAKEKECNGQCPVTVAMKKLPEISYRVNGKNIQGCVKCAEKASKETGKPVMFVVGTKEFKDHGKAMTEVVVATEKMVADFAKPCKCEKSGTITVAGTKCDCPIKAADTAKLVTTAMNKVQMQYKIGSESCDCPTKAASLAAKTGKPKEFVVNGECTTCEMTARLNLARAKYKAGVELMASVAKKSEK